MKTLIVLASLYHSDYLKFMERARSEWLRDLGFNRIVRMREQRVAFAIKNIAVDFIRPVRLEDMLIVGVTLQCFGRASLNFEHKISSMTDELLCYGHVKVACDNADTLRPRQIPHDLMYKIPKV